MSGPTLVLVDWWCGSIFHRATKGFLLREALLKPRTPAPQFSLQTSDGTLLHSTDYVGKKPVVIFSYPKDETLGCIIESCAFRDAYKDFPTAPRGA